MKDILFFLRLFKPYWHWLFAGILLSLFTAISGIILLSISGWFISSAAITVTETSTLLFHYVQPTVYLRSLTLFRTVSRYGERIITHEATFRILAQIRIWFFAQLIPLATGRLALLRSGDLLARMTSDIDALDALYLRFIAPLTVAAFGLSAVLIFIQQYHPLLSLYIGIILLFASIIIPLIFNRLGNQGAKAIMTLTADFKTRQIEILQGLNDLIAFQAYTRFQTKLREISRQLIATQRKNNRLTAYSTALTVLISQLSLLLTLIVVASALQENLLKPTDAIILVFCTLAIFELITPLAPAMQMLGKLQQAAQHIKTVASLPPTIIEPTKPLAIPNSYALHLENISFRYYEQQPWLMQQLSLKIPHGAKIAILGHNGIGKTSFLQLLLRFFDPQHGRITLAGIDYSQLHSDDILACFGLLSQRSQLFATTIKGNLLLGKANATDAELQAAIAIAGLENFIAKLPEGLNTWVGEQGLKVSGGEARRIALARVYLKNAPILLLDEPTEGLDAQTEMEVLQALKIFAENKTLIMVTHRSAGLNLVEQVYRFTSSGLTLLSVKPTENALLLN